MKGELRRLIKDFIPPIVLRGATGAFRSGVGGAFRGEQGEKPPAWYDASFEQHRHWRVHYTQSRYYFLWTVIVDRLVRARVKSVLEIGCGPGQLACLHRDRGISGYHGVDFSPKRIEQARQVCPQFAFTVDDAFRTELFTTFDYDAVICTEFLEHVERDIDILNRIRVGAHFYGTVPNFPFTSHVRHFRSESEVLSRYASSFRDLRVDAFLADAQRKTFYLLEGIRI